MVDSMIPGEKGPIMAKNIGLRDVFVADTKVSHVDGIKGKIVYRGFTIETLAEHSSYEETAFLLLHGRLPTRAELGEFDTALRLEHSIPQALLEWAQSLPKSIPAMAVVQGAIPILAAHDPDLTDDSREANLRKAIRLIAKLPTAVATWARAHERKPVVPPRADLSHAANFLYMLTGKVPDEQIAKDFDVCLILHADHSFNASTFTCRVVASTRANMHASIAAAVGALSGSLHGGANEEVMKMLKEIGTVDRAELWVKEALDRGERIMGVGHAVYRTYDPRARILKVIAGRLAERTTHGKWFEMTKQLEDITRKEFEARGKARLHPNVDFYSGTVYTEMGIPTDLFTPVFAISRIAGWCAHVIEEKFADAQPKAVIYRPEATYTGPGPDLEGLPYTPIDQRK
ncbi:MAG: citrate/2-methylcitrate synthase [Candidatus Coatesbacteria bacterium]